MQKDIIIKGARQHNLKNMDVTLPRDKFIVITGLSGSGKSTLAFDTIYAEGQRRYVESLSSYARQFLGLMTKPDVDLIEGLSPAISIEQKSISHNPRSTVGTVTEIYDYLRLLFARVGVPHCPECKRALQPQTTDAIVTQIMKKYKDKKIEIFAPIIRQKKGTYERLFAQFLKEGFTRSRVNGKLVENEDPPKLARYKKHDIYPMVDRIRVSNRSRVFDSVQMTLQKSEGLVIISSKGKDELFSTHATCPEHGISFPELQPRMFSFNSPFGACETCHGLGIEMDFDEDLIVPDKKLSLADGAIKAWSNKANGWRYKQLIAVCQHYKIDMLAPYNKLSEDKRNILMYGSDEEVKFKYVSKDGTSSFSHQGDFEGVINTLHRLFHQTTSEWRKRDMSRYMVTKDCRGCSGQRLSEKILHIWIDEKSIIDVTQMSIKDALFWLTHLELDKKRATIARQVLKEVNSRLQFLFDVGLSYLTLSRAAGTLSGGEAQRIRLATQIGSRLTGVLYVLDEPSIGLHQRDNVQLINTLYELRDLGNTLIVVEHDEDTMLAADHIVDIGPGPGIHGGEVVAQGTPTQIIKEKNSLTGQYLSKKKQIAYNKDRRKGKGTIKILSAQENNLKKIDVTIPTRIFNCITGVSGSGKSTLIDEILRKGMMRLLHDSSDKPGKHDKIIISDAVTKLIVIDQSPIGRTPRSNPVTYTKAFDEIRKLFSMTKDAKERGYAPGQFSFNVRGGRCEACQGGGMIKIEMNFLPDMYIECEDCKGTRYHSETLEVKYKNKNIAEVLAMSVEEALVFFEHVPSLQRILQTLMDVGLGYIKLGQSSTTLSGGEAQRIKLTRELAKRSYGHVLYLLDEPTTGLHFEDINKLLSVFNRLVDKGNTLVVIEHNLDVIKNADWIIDLGPDGGDAGGEIIAQGIPEEIIKVKKSYTGQFLKKIL